MYIGVHNLTFCYMSKFLSATDKLKIRLQFIRGVYGSNQDQRRIVVRTTSGDVEVTGYRLTRQSFKIKCEKS